MNPSLGLDGDIPVADGPETVTQRQPLL